MNINLQLVHRSDNTSFFLTIIEHKCNVQVRTKHKQGALTCLAYRTYAVQAIPGLYTCILYIKHEFSWRVSAPTFVLLSHKTTTEATEW